MTLKDLLNKCTRKTRIKLIIDNGDKDKTTRHYDSAIELYDSVSFRIYKDWTVDYIQCENDYLVITIF